VAKGGGGLGGAKTPHELINCYKIYYLYVFFNRKI
jgi:hypothetical protein